MAAQSEEAVEVVSAIINEDSAVAPGLARGSQVEEGMEMTALSGGSVGGGGSIGGGGSNGAGEGGEGENSNLKVVVHSTNVPEASVMFIVKDITTTDWQKSRHTCSLPLSTAIVDLYAAVAKEAGKYNC